MEILEPTSNKLINKTLPPTHGSIQPWISDLAKQADSRASFNELIDTPVDFSAFLMNRLNVDTLTPELLVGLTYELMKGSCKSIEELEFFLEEVYKLEAEFLTRSSNSSKTSYAVAIDLSKLELKKILIEKIESNKSIHQSDEQRNLYKALVNSYECHKLILDTYGDTDTLKRRRDGANKDEEPFVGSNRGV
nr:hypothetical protein [Tanacetum cinerariifolium]